MLDCRDSDGPMLPLDINNVVSDHPRLQNELFDKFPVIGADYLQAAAEQLKTASTA